jgi:hypothetical protein
VGIVVIYFLAARVRTALLIGDILEAASRPARLFAPWR